MAPASRRRTVRTETRSLSGNIKADPEPILNDVSEAGTVTFDLGNHRSVISNRASSTSYVPVSLNQAFYRNERSDAPTPSERLTEPEPLLRELRMRPNAAESPTSLDHTESFFQSSFQDIGKKLKACNDTLGELQQLGVSHDVQLPELVLVGDQSAGKSSLMSGLANLDLPRSEGTCTRCPLHISVSRHSEWSCRVWLRKDYSYEPPQDRSISETDVTDDDPFFPWRKLRNPQVHEFKTMHEMKEIEDVLRWAQIAILNDGKSHKLFVPGSGSVAQSTPVARAAEEVMAKFSPNIVALEIKGPELPDLSFYDMPGIFQNPADARDDYLVSVVRNLSKEYIQHPSAVIICSMPMNSDAENSSTFGLARRLAALDRTIGVLTKADLLPEGGNHDQWLYIMNGTAHQTGLGYFITSRPQGLDQDELKQHEEAIFDNHSYDKWPAEFHGFVERSGVERLKAFLSERLGEEFAKSLPTIKRKVKHHLDRVNSDLAKLPELPKNVELVVHRSVADFGDLARAALSPIEFSGRLGDLPDQFRECLLEMKPRFTLKDRTDTPVLEISDDESDAGSTTTNGNAVTPSKRRTMAPPVTPSKRQRSENTPNPMPFNGNGLIKPEEGRGSVPPPPSPMQRPSFPEAFAQFRTVGRGFRTLRQVQEEIALKTRAGFPNIITEVVYSDLCREAVLPWEGPMNVFLTKVMNTLKTQLGQALRRAFAPLIKRLVYEKSRQALNDYLSDRLEETKQSLHIIYRREIFCLFTLNKEAFQECEKKEGTLVIRFRHQMRMQAAGYSDGKGKPPIAWEHLNDDKRVQDTKQREADLAKIGPDPFEREIRVISYVRGYYRLAALRFADSVALAIISDMIPEIRRYLPFELEKKLGLEGPDADTTNVYERLMAEDDATANKRVALKAEREKFEKALASIEVLEAGSGGNSGFTDEEHDVEMEMSGALNDDEA